MKNTDPAMSCPACGADLPQQVQRRLDSFWAGRSSAPCPGCAANLGYDRPYRDPAFLSRQIFRYSALAAVLLAAIRLATDLREPVLNVNLAFAIIGMSTGIAIGIYARVTRQRRRPRLKLSQPER